MMQELLEALRLIRDHFADGFASLLAIAVVAPWLGVLLVLRRLPLLALAVPQMAGCGQAAAFFAFALLWTVDQAQPEAPGRALQMLGASAGVLVGLGALLWAGGDRRYLGAQAGILYLVARGAQQLLYLESPYRHAFEHAAEQGHLLTVLAPGRNQVLATCAVLAAAAWAAHRRLWISAFDPDQARLNGIAPRRWFAGTLLLIGMLCGLCVPVVGAEVVLTLLLVPPTVLRACTPSLRAFAPLSVVAGVLGSVAAFVLGCTRTLDWPPGPTLVLSVLAASLCCGAVARLFRTR
ncbi:MAG: metal ABC transporter permease [Planctomycetes bacterium]|nr:metal ABC transporter permease [Planctomycetota bacterium]